MRWYFRRSVTLIRRHLCLWVAIFGCSFEAEGADLYWQKVDGHVQIFIEGPIGGGDEIEFRNLVLRLANAGQVISHVTVFSAGGAVWPALSIGRQIRTLRLSTAGPMRNPQIGPKTVHCYRRSYTEDGKVVAPHLQRHWSLNTPKRFQSAASPYQDDARCVCTSACFLIWAGGLGRSGDWIGLHRPYFERHEYAKLSVAEAEKSYGEMVEVVKTYLAEMGIPEFIVHKMMGANSENLHFLTSEEAKNLDNQAATEELMLARCGSYVQLRNEWDEVVRRRDARALKQVQARQEAYNACSGKIVEEVFAESLTAYRRQFAN